MSQATDLLDGILQDKPVQPATSIPTSFPAPATKSSVLSQISGSSGQQSKSPVDDKPAGPDQGEALIAMCDSMTLMSMKVIALRYKVKWCPALEKSCRLSEVEKQSLRICARDAATFVSGLISKSQNIAGIMFLALWGSMLWMKKDDIKALVPVKKQHEEVIQEQTQDQPQADKPKRGRPRKQ